MANINKLSARAAASAKPGRHGDGGGLYLVVSPTGSAKWVFRFTRNGKVTEMGLGSNSAVSLAQARAKATIARSSVADGINPIEARRQAGRDAAGKPTFGQCALALIEAKSSSWRNARHRDQWSMTLTEYAKPLRDLPVDAVDTGAVLSVLQPLWKTTPETASRLRGRIEAVIDSARAKGHIGRNEANPARWRGHLDMLLAKRSKLSRGHHAAMPFHDIAEFVGKLRVDLTVTAQALEFLILTAARRGEVLGAMWSEVDMDRAVWTIPAARMKAGVEHRVPLSARALAILIARSGVRHGDVIFAGQRPALPLSGASIERVLRRTDGAEATIHGFRSSFRDWCAEETQFPREIAEAALAHSVGSAVEMAYRRGDALEKRRILMQDWSNYLDGAEIVEATRAAG
jgi:integrase